MKYILLLNAFGLFILFHSPVALATEAWPSTDATGTSIGATLINENPALEPSGVAWSEYWDAYVVVGDEGEIALLGVDGTVLDIWNIGSSYDLEDVATIDSSAHIYLLDENNSHILEFDTVTGELTGLAWDVSAYITEVGGTAGAEGLTWIPDAYHPYEPTTSGGLWYVGWQQDGDIYVFDVDFEASGTANLIDTIETTPEFTDVSGLYFNTQTEVLYVIYDGLNIIEERGADGTLVESYALPGNDQEGVVIVPDTSTTADITIAEDSGRVMTYVDYPITLAVIDADNDGLPADIDTNDSIPNNGIEILYDGVSNDGDAEIDERNRLSTNGLHPYYSTLDASDTELYGRDIESVGGLRYGRFRVRFADNSAYRYSAPLSHTRRHRVRAQIIDGSGYVLVRNHKRAAIVNALTGEHVARRLLPGDRSVLSDWIHEHTGLTL